MPDTLILIAISRLRYYSYTAVRASRRYARSINRNCCNQTCFEPLLELLPRLYGRLEEVKPPPTQSINQSTNSIHLIPDIVAAYRRYLVRLTLNDDVAPYPDERSVTAQETREMAPSSACASHRLQRRLQRRLMMLLCAYSDARLAVRPVQ